MSPFSKVKANLSKGASSIAGIPKRYTILLSAFSLLTKVNIWKFCTYQPKFSYFISQII